MVGLTSFGLTRERELLMQDYNVALPPRWLKMELFVNYHRIMGEIMTAELRTNGVLNSPDPQLLLERVTTSHLLKPRDEALASGFARVAKDSITLAIPNDEHETERLARAARIYSRGELLQQRVMLVMGQFEVSGNLHLDPDTEISRVFLQRSEFFIGVTDVAIVFLPNPSVRFTANSALINRSRVDFLCAGAP